MSRKYYKNFILCGVSLYYCLICDEKFDSIRFTDNHIRWQNHKVKVEKQSYIHKYRKHFIYQVQSKFYCELCNFVFNNESELKEHIANEDHLERKANPQEDRELEAEKFEFCGINKCYFYDTYFIRQLPWHTIDEGRCETCSMVIGYTNEAASVHMRSKSHLINLAQTKIIYFEFEEFHDCYRMLKNSIAYCFLCRVMLPYMDAPEHCADQAHILKSNENVKDQINLMIDDTKLLQKIMDVELKRKKHIDDLRDVRKKFNIGPKKDVAICKKCNAQTPNKYRAMSEHTEKCKVIPEPGPATVKVDVPAEKDKEMEIFQFKDHGKIRSKLAAYGRNHHIKLNPGGSQAYCLLCYTVLCPSFKLFIEHTTGPRHCNFLEIINQLPPKQVHKIPSAKHSKLLDYIRLLYYSSSMHAIVINGGTSVNVFNFAMIQRITNVKFYNQTKCFLCQIVYPTGGDKEHFSSLQHKINFLDVRVLSLKNEFVREIKHNIFHCGVCGKVFPYWEMMERHLTSFKHNAAKRKSMKMIELFESDPEKFNKVKLSDRVDLNYDSFVELDMFKNFTISN